MDMKIRLSIISAGGLIGGLSIIQTARAIEPPPESATPPAALLQEEIAPDKTADNSPFVGVATVGVPDMVADHLGLTDGSGVIIRTVCPDSPAEKAGLSVNDIIVNLDGKAVADPEAFSAAIRNHKVGDHLKIDLIHKGNPAKVEVTLTGRPMDATAQLDAEPLLDGIPKIHADRLRGLIEQNLGAFGRGGQGAIPDQQFEDTFRQMRERMNRAFGEQANPNPTLGGGGGLSFQQNSTIRLMDSEGSVEINSSEGDTEVKVRGKDNSIVWSGPWNTEENKASAPKDIRERIDKINSVAGTGFSFRFGKRPSEPDTIDN